MLPQRSDSCGKYYIMELCLFTVIMQKDLENSFIYTMSDYFNVRAAFKQRLLCFLGGETHRPNRQKLKNEEDILSLERLFCLCEKCCLIWSEWLDCLSRCDILTVDSEWQNSRALRGNCTEGGKENEILPQTQLLYVPNWSNKGLRTLTIDKTDKIKRKKKTSCQSSQKKRKKILHIC